MLARSDTKVRGRFCERRCGPSRRGERNASAVLTNFVRQPEKTFSTVSANCGHSRRPQSENFSAMVRAIGSINPDALPEVLAFAGLVGIWLSGLAAAVPTII
jgi:hypothetical protein